MVFEGEVLEWLRSGRLYVFRDAAGEPRAFYVDTELLQEPPWWVENRRLDERQGVDAGREATEALQEFLDKLSS